MSIGSGRPADRVKPPASIMSASATRQSKTADPVKGRLAGTDDDSICAKPYSRCEGGCQALVNHSEAVGASNERARQAAKAKQPPR